MRKLVAGLLIGAAAAIVAAGASAAGLLERAELTAYDWRVRRAASPANANPDIVMVEINDATVRDLAPVVGRWPWRPLRVRPTGTTTRRLRLLKDAHNAKVLPRTHLLLLTATDVLAGCQTIPS